MHIRPLSKRSTWLMATSALALCVSGIAMADEAKPADQDTVVVHSFRASLQNALSNKKNSNLIIESVTAEDMGKFPDQNITESLQRLPGVQINRENGQGTKVLIRGLDQNVTTLNGDIFVTGLEAFRLGEGTFQNTNSLEGIPSDLLGGVDVIKSPQADVLEGGLGGVVNLKTRNARDLRQDTTFSTDIRVNKGSDSKSQPNVSAVFGHKFSTDFAILATLSYDKNNIDNELLQGENRGTWAFLDRPTTANPASGVAANPDIWSPEYRYHTNRHQERERTAFSLNADARLSDSLTLRADWFHSDLKIFTYENSLKYSFNNEGAIYTSAGLTVDTNGVLQSGTVTANSFEGDTFAQNAEAKTDNFQISSVWNNGGNLTGKFRAAYSKSDYDSTSGQVDTRYTAYGVRDGITGHNANPGAPSTATYTYTNGDNPSILPNATMLASAINPANVFFKSHWAFGESAKTTNSALSADFKYRPDFGQGSNLLFSFGVRAADRKVDATFGRYLADYSAKGELPASAQGTTDHGTFVDWTPYGYFQDGAIGLKKCDIAFYGCSRFGTSVAVVTPYQTAATNPGRAVTATVGGVTALFQDGRQMKDPVSWIQGLYPSTAFKFFADPIQSFRIEDKTTTTYAMADVGAPTDGFHLNAGVRIVQTKLIIHSNNTPVTPLWWGTDSWNGVLKNPDAALTTREYTDVLPSMSGVFNINETDKLRASAARVVSAQNLFQLGQGASYNFTRNSDPLSPNFNKFIYTNGSGGNQNLDPYRASQFDLAYEHYFGKQGIISGGVFYKNIDSFIEQDTYSVTVADQSVAGSTQGTFSSPINGRGGTIKGVEVQAQYSFESGFGFTANATYSDSKSPYSNDFDSKLPVPGVSKFAYNLQGYYENGPLQTRISYAWKDKAYLGNYGFGSGADVHSLGIWNKAYGQLDGQIAYDITPALKLTVEGSNLTGEASKTYLQFANLPFRYTSGDRRITIGVRYRFGG